MRVVRSRPQLTYPIIGFLLGAGAPIGAFVTRLLTSGEVRSHPVDDLKANAFFYLYDLIATALVFAIAGFIAGRRAERLRRGEEFYHHLAEHDSLTGLHNARAFMDRYRRALERAVGTGRPLAVILLDVDRLKAINDDFGHLSGNEALTHVADALRRSKRGADIAARWGGDEFSILMDGADAAAATRVANTIVAWLKDLPLRLEGTSVPVTVTIGIAHAATPSLNSDLFVAADRALFAGKARGRNTIEIVAV
jgi:diguanylate cyclase (GGDEF)-like protein